MKPNFFQRHWKKGLVTIIVVIVFFMSLGIYLGNQDDTVYQEPSRSRTSAPQFDDYMNAPSESSYPSPSAISTGKAALRESASTGNTARKVSKTVDADIEVQKGTLAEKIAALQTFITSKQGYVISSRESKETVDKDEYSTTDIAFKVPFAELEKTLAYVRTVGDVQSLNSYTTDLTNQYQDTQAYIDSYQKEKEQIEKLLAKADKIADIITIEQKLSEIQRNIDQNKKDLINLGRQTDYITVNLHVSEKQNIQEVRRYLTPFTELATLFTKSFNAAIEFLMVVIGFAIPIGIIWLLWRGARRLFGRR